MPRMACRVVCGLDEAMAILLPTSALVSVDLPAFGRPTKQAKPDLNTGHRPDLAGAVDMPDHHVRAG